MQQQIQIYKELPQLSEEWHRLRLGKITGSSFYKMLGGSTTAEKYLYEKASEIVTGAKSDGEKYSNVHIQRGLEWESTARNSYKRNKGVQIEEVGLIQLGDYIACSPDGLVGDDGMIEIKVPDSSNFLKLVLEISVNGKEAISNDHYYQMQFNLYVANRQWCDYVLYNNKFWGKDLFCHRVERDEVCIDAIKKTLDKGIKQINEYVELYNNIMGNKNE